VDENEFLKALDSVAKRLSKKFRFGYHEIEDIKQQAAIFALEGLEKYDSNRPLENFLWTHVRNRLFNYKRNNYQRPDKPCLKCPLFDPHLQKSNNGCLKYQNKDECEPYKNWSNRNESKKNIMSLQNLENINEYNNSKTIDPLDISGNNELINFLDKNIVKPEYRETYIKLKNNIKVSAANLNKLKKHVQLLLKEKSNDNNS